MKKLYSGKGKRIHPSPPSSSSSSPLSFLSAALLTLAAALSPEEKEVLAYLLSDIASEKKKPLHSPLPQRNIHPPDLGCRCFGCYKSFWARWDASPNHHLIHHILDAVEDSLDPPRSLPSAPRRSRSRRRRHSRRKKLSPPAAAEASNPADEDGDDENAEEEEDEEEFEEVAGDGEDGRSPVRRLVSFIGERVWGVWNC